MGDIKHTHPNDAKKLSSDNLQTALDLEYKHNESDAPYNIFLKMSSDHALNAERLAAKLDDASEEEQVEIVIQIEHEVKRSRESQVALAMELHKIMSFQPVDEYSSSSETKTVTPYPVGSSATHTCRVHEYEGTFQCSPLEQQCRDQSDKYCSVRAIRSRLDKNYHEHSHRNQRKMVALRKKSHSIQTQIQSLKRRQRDLERQLKENKSNISYVKRFADKPQPSVQLLRHHQQNTTTSPSKEYSCAVKNRNIRVLCDRQDCPKDCSSSNLLASLNKEFKSVIH